MLTFRFRGDNLCTSGLLVKVLVRNRKVAGLSLARCRLFSPMSILEVFTTPYFGGDVKLSVLESWLILATFLLSTFGKIVVEKEKV